MPRLAGSVKNDPAFRRALLSPGLYALSLKDKFAIKNWPGRLVRAKTDGFPAALIFAVTLVIFWISPIYQVTDSKYSMLVSESLLHHGTFKLDSYAIPRGKPVKRPAYLMVESAWQLELVHDHVYYFYPPGSSVLSLPYVALMNAFGITASHADGTFDYDGEIAIETSLAAILMALLAAIFFFTARTILPTSWSIVIALGSALGTQVWSTASRGLWSDTWGIFLSGLVVWMLVGQETGRRKIDPVILATLLAWTYIVRPTNAIQVIAISAYVFIFYRRLFWKYAITGVFWAAGFVAYSWHNFSRPLPNYYLSNQLSFRAYPVVLIGHLISPSRGLLIFSPVLLFVAYALIRVRAHLPLRRLLWLSLTIIAGYVLVVSGWENWWGGAGYGPRLMTGLVPWFVMLAILGTRAMLDWRRQDQRKVSRFEWSATLTTAALLLSMSIFTNARGAWSYATAKWHGWPVLLELDPSRLWDWRQPQFLAGLLPPPLPREFPSTDGLIDVRQKEANKYLWYGWSDPENDFRWTDEHEAAVIFAADDLNYSHLRIMLAPFLAGGRRAEQRVTINLNGQSIGTLNLKNDEPQDYLFTIPGGAFQRRNVLKFELPDATSPRHFRISPDQRLLGVAVQWIKLEP